MASDVICKTEELTAGVTAAVQRGARHTACSYRKFQIACSVRFNGNKTSRVVLICYLLIFSGSAAQRGLWPPRSRGFLITHNDATQSVGLIWTNDQLVAETSTEQHTHTTDKHPCPRWDSNPRSQQASGRSCIILLV
jgi:hypothetical protein